MKEVPECVNLFKTGYPSSPSPLPLRIALRATRSSQHRLCHIDGIQAGLQELLCAVLFVEEAFFKVRCCQTFQ